MRSFELVAPGSLEEAAELLAASDDAKAIAGGTSLIVLIKQGIYAPARLVNLRRVPAAAVIEPIADGGLRIGALATIADVERSPLVRERYPILAAACHVVANIRIRNMATLGGNVAHADYQSDPPTALVALDAEVELLSIAGTRRLPIRDFLFGTYETALEHGEVLAAILLPPQPVGRRGTYLKFTTRSSEDRPCAGVAVMLSAQDGVCDRLRVVIGAISPTPVVIEAAETLASGQLLTDALIDEIGHEAAGAVDPIEDLRGPAPYKRHLAGVLAARAIRSTLAGAGGTP